MQFDSWVFVLLFGLFLEVGVLLFSVIRNAFKTEDKITLIDSLRYSINIGSILAPFAIVFIPELINIFWDLSLYSVFILMAIRPIRDLWPSLRFPRLMPLRKNLGIFSSIIVVTFALVHYIPLGLDFFPLYFSLSYWSFSNNLFWAHMGELTGAILLLTSNNFSIGLLKRNWKRIQRLSYVYFLSGAWYVFSSFGKSFGLIAIVSIFGLVFLAYAKKFFRRHSIPLLQTAWDKRLASIVSIVFIVGLVVTSMSIINYGNTIARLEQDDEASVLPESTVLQYQDELSAIQLENQNLISEINRLQQINGEVK